MLLLPGMPKWPIVIVGAVAFFGWLRIRKDHGEAAFQENEDEAKDASLSIDGPNSIELRLGSQLMDAWEVQQALLLDRISKQRESIERNLGFSHPKVSILANADLGGLDYEIAVYGDTYGKGMVHPDRLLAIKQNEGASPIEGISGKDPAYGLEGFWIEKTLAETARRSGYSVVEPEAVVTAHISEVIKSEISALMTRAATVELLDQVRVRQPGLIEELVPNIMTASDVQRVLQNLLQERVSIANIDLILETLVDIGRHTNEPAILSERLREHLAVSICSSLRGANADLSVLSLDPRVENRIIANLGEGAGENLISADPRLAEQLLRSLAPMVDNMVRQGRSPVLLCASPIRRAMVRLAQRTIPHLSVISVDEIPLRTALSSFGIVKLPENEPA